MRARQALLQGHSGRFVTLVYLNPTLWMIGEEAGKHLRGILDITVKEKSQDEVGHAHHVLHMILKTVALPLLS